MTEFKQIRLNPEVRGLLDDYKMEGESYSIAIGRLFKEKKMLEESKAELIHAYEGHIKTLKQIKN